jgi:hypothetical protein
MNRCDVFRGTLWSTPGFPRKGWTLLDVEDLEEDFEDLAVSCHACEYEPLRYVHTIEHPEWPSALEVGCVCCEHLTCDYVLPRRRERELKARAGRRQRWLTRRWRVSRKGNPFIRAHGHHVVIVRNSAGRWTYCLDGRWSPSILAYTTLEGAKLAAFDAIPAQEVAHRDG